MLTTGKRILLHACLTYMTAALVVQPSAAADPGGQEFKVILTSSINGKTAKDGDQLRATLAAPLHIGDKTFPTGSTVTGRITEVAQARRHILAEVSPKRWLRSGGSVGMEFDEVAGGGRRARIHAIPVGMPKAVKEDQKKLAIGSKGRLERSRQGEVKPKLTRMGLGVAAVVGAPFTAAIGGVTGAVKPGAVLSSSDPEDLKHVKHRRLKGMATGAIAGIPGGFLINDTLIKGRNITIRPGTELILRLD